MHSEGQSEQKAIKNFRAKGAWAHPGTAQLFWGTPYYPRKGKSDRLHIWPVHSEGQSDQKRIKIFQENGARAYPETAHFSGYPLGLTLRALA